MLEDSVPVAVTKPLAQSLTLSQDSARYLYIRDNDSGEFWSAWWHPSGSNLERFEARHSVGSTTIESTAHEINCATTFFVPIDLPAELWQIKLRNTSNRKRRLSVFLFTSWPETSGLSQASFRDNTIVSVSTDNTNQVVARFLTLDHAADSFDCSPDQFIGRDGSLANPKAVRDGKCSRSVAENEPAIGVLQRTITLGAQTETHFTAMLGAAIATTEQTAVHSVKNITKKLQGQHAIEKMLQETKSYWEKETSRTVINSPESGINAATNIWSKYQTIAPDLRQASVARFLELLFLRIPILSSVVVKEQLRKGFSYHYHDGRLAESFTDSSSPTENITGLCWLIIATITYIKESGDLAFLRHAVAYRDSGTATISEHIVRAMRYCESQREEIEESLPLMLYAYCLKELPALFSAVGEHDVIRHYNNLETSMRTWFERRFWNKGMILSNLNNSGEQISFANQFWSIYSGMLQEKKAKQTLAIVEKTLATIYGVRTDTHASNNIHYDQIAQYALLQATHEDSDTAYIYFTRHLPMRDELNQELFVGEPYIFPAFIHGPQSVRKGQTGLGWDGLAGGWSYKYVTEYLLGITTTVGGLKIDPHLPRDWRQVDIAREFRNAHYHIRIQNPLRSSRQIDRIIVDGLRVAGNVIRPFSTGNHFIEVILG